jgi:hypothetical protein
VIAAGMLYLESALLLAVGASLFWALARLLRTGVAARAAQMARAASLAVIAALLLPILWNTAGTATGTKLPVQVWSGSEGRAEVGREAAVVTIGALPGVPSWRLGSRTIVWLAAAVALGGLLSLVQLGWRARRMRLALQRLPVVRRRGRVVICAADRCGAPFAARVGGRAYIVLPTGMWSDLGRVRLVVAHEGHHHRSGHLAAGRALAICRALFCWNPAVYLWERLLAELHELACDRFVVERRGDARDYARCLVWAAELAGAPRFAAALPMAAAGAAFLHRRIEMLQVKSTRGRWAMIGLTGALTALVAASALAHAAVGDRRIDRARAEAAAARGGRDALPVVVDEALLKALNQTLATPQERAKLARALERMGAFRPMLDEVLAGAGLPPELAAVALMESGFDNGARPGRPNGGAGIWQLVPGTARAQGLRVEGASDERLDPRRETAAAAALLGNLHRSFGDWLLALTAYSRGSSQVRKLVDESGGDGSELYRRGLLGGYPTQIMVGVLVLRDPSLME